MLCSLLYIIYVEKWNYHLLALRMLTLSELRYLSLLSLKHVCVCLSEKKKENEYHLIFVGKRKTKASSILEVLFLTSSQKDVTCIRKSNKSFWHHLRHNINWIIALLINLFFVLLLFCVGVMTNQMCHASNTSWLIEWQ